MIANAPMNMNTIKRKIKFSRRLAKKWANTTFSLSALLFVISLTQNAYTTDGPGDNQMDAIIALLAGWYGVFYSQLSWFANPCLIIAWIFLLGNNIKIATFWSFLAFCFSVSFLFYKNIFIDEAEYQSKIISYNIGYWLWLSSCSIMLLGNLLFILLASRDKKQRSKL